MILVFVAFGVDEEGPEFGVVGYLYGFWIGKSYGREARANNRHFRGGKEGIRSRY